MQQAQGDALGHVSGYTCFMDGSVREYQRHALTTGKNFWRSGAMGPWIVTADEVGGTDMTLRTLLNGDMVQSTQASLMVSGSPRSSRTSLARPGRSRST